jgi:uncharacterized membrane protein
MKRKIFTLLCLFSLLGVYAADNYCTGPSVTNGRGSRVFKEIVVTKTGKTDPLFTGIVHETKPNTNFDIYQDRTNQEFSVNAGDELSISYSNHAAFEWVHLYVFIDYNQDKEFKEEDGELVSYTNFNGKNSLGEDVDFNNVALTPSVLPSFTIPATAYSGKTRIRITSGWNTKDPCDPTGGNNNDNNNIIDFTINIAGGVQVPKVSINHTSTPGGQLAVRNNATMTLIEDGAQISKGSSIAVIAKADAGYKAQSVKINGEDKTNQCASPNGYNCTANNDIDIQAVFAKEKYLFTYTFDNTKGIAAAYDAVNAIEVLSGSPVEHGLVVSIFIMPYANKHIKSALVNDVEKLKELTPYNGGYILSVTITENTEVEIVLAVEAYKLTYNNPENGTITVSLNGNSLNNESVIHYDDELAITLTPDAGYELTSLIINEEEFLEDVEDNYIEYLVSEDMNIVATFGLKAAINNIGGENEISAYADRTGALIVKGAPAGSIVNVYNVMGQKVEQATILSGKTVIPSKRLPEGLYIVKVNYNNKRKSFKIAKKY